MEKINQIRKIVNATGFEEELGEFLDAKEKYLKDPTKQNLIDMKRTYQLIYSDIKHLWVNGVISEQDFWIAVDELKEGVD